MTDKESNTGTTGGIGFCGLLAIVFIVLKLLNVITWSWIWVLSPLWIPFIIVFGLIITTVLGLGYLYSKK